MSEEINVNRDWNVKVNLSGLNAPTGAKKVPVEVPEGFYTAKVTDMYVNPDHKPNRVILKMTISEGAFKGVVRTDGLNIPKDESDNVRYYWRGLAESAGYSPAQLDAGSIELGRDTFIDRDVHIHFTPKDKTTSGYEQIDYLAPSEWNQQRQVFEASNRTEGAPNGPSGSALGATGGGSEGTTKKSDVLTKLGLGGQANA